MPKMKVVGETVQVLECPQTDERMLPSTLSPCFAKAKQEVQQRAKQSDYQSKMFVCVSNNHADAVDQLLICESDLSLCSNL